MKSGRQLGTSAETVSRQHGGTSVTLDGVTKAFGSVLAVDDLSLDIPAGKFVSLLGPSGCGKTSCLRLIAGFEAPTRGRILLQQRDVTRVPPYRRNLGMVFQSYALFPHLTVAENVAFGLKMRRVPRSERSERTSQTLSLVKLDRFKDRYPKQLSGGQQQRVALARAIVFNPAVLLLDESLAALDKSLREEMQMELRNLQKQLGITAVFVTHDQEEALTMSDLVVVMNQGRIEQAGAPNVDLRAPEYRIRRALPGRQQYPEREGRSGRRHAGATLSLLGRRVRVGVGARAAGQMLSVSLRPERIGLEAAHEADPYALRVDDVVFRGLYRHVTLAQPGASPLVAVVGNTSSAASLEPGAWVKPAFEAESVVLLQAARARGTCAP